MPGDRQEQFDQLARAYPLLDIRARLKQAPEDFIVEEVLPFELTGQGEHAWLQLCKCNTNTDWLASKIAAFAAVKKQAVGYAGLKDRFAVTTQWFSVYLPGRDDVDWNRLELDGVELLQATRHQRKLQRGALKLNRFMIRLRDIEQDCDDCADRLHKRCEQIRRQGVPNYFGEQRFGHDAGNLVEAERLFSGRRKRISRHKRSLYLSAARSWLFNAIVSHRVLAGSWNQRVSGDVFMLDGRSACFPDDESSELEQRIERGEIHPTAVLWGEGESMTTAECEVIESAVVDQYPEFKQGLIDARVQRQRRAMRLMVRDIECTYQAPDLLLSFSLQAGSYATMVLRELVSLR